MDIVSVALKRYSTKAFDPTKKLTAEQAEKLKRCCSLAHPAPTLSHGILSLPVLMKVKRVWPNPQPAALCSTNVKCWMLPT